MLSSYREALTHERPQVLHFTSHPWMTRGARSYPRHLWVRRKASKGHCEACPLAKGQPTTSEELPASAVKPRAKVLRPTTSMTSALDRRTEKDTDAIWAMPVSPGRSKASRTSPGLTGRPGMQLTFSFTWKCGPGIQMRMLASFGDKLSARTSQLD